MGYESKIYICEKSGIKDNDGMTYVQVIAMFDMCKMGNLINVFDRKTDCYFYADDGDTKVLEDKYGDALTEAEIEDFIYVLTIGLDNIKYTEIDDMDFKEVIRQINIDYIDVKS